MKKITKKLIGRYREHLILEEKSEHTIAKYIRDINAFYAVVNDKPLTKSDVLTYKESLSASYAASSVNSILSSLNSFFTYNEWFDLKVKTVKIQKQIFMPEDRELSKNEYLRLLNAASLKSNKRLYLVMQTLCACGIRVSELKYITVNAVNQKWAEVNCKGKTRIVLLPDKLCGILKKYIKEKNIISGSVFVTRSGLPLDRSNIWSDMKKLCISANVSPKKVFPHNLRHLFARTYYTFQKDIVRLADILGHSNVNTTRIYTTESSDLHRCRIQKLDLIIC